MLERSDLEDVPCDLCGSERRRALYEIGDVRYGRPSPSYRVSRCRDCRLVYVSPRPPVDRLGELYPADYDADRRVDNPAIRRRFEAQADLVGPAGGRLLDVGAAQGAFVEWMRGRGWDAGGVDPFARKDAPSSHVLAAPLESPALEENAHDVVTAWHVLEHVPAPGRTLERIRSLLKSGGRLCLSVPNFESYRGTWLKAEDVPRHLYGFGEGTLLRYAAKAGFRPLAVSYRDAFASDALGRGAFTRHAYCRLGGLSLYDYHRARIDPARSLAAEHPVARQVARVLDWFERRLLTSERLERNGRMGVVAMVWGT